MNLQLEQIGSNCSRVVFGNLVIGFSYETPVTFDDGERTVARENIWGPTTGRHYGLLKAPRDRITGELFQTLLNEAIRKEAVRLGGVS